MTVFELPMMAQIHTHYDNLKVARNAPPEVIRAAYKILSQKYHPDRNGNNPDAIRVIQIINTAYAVLSDPEKRREHDEWIARTEAQAGAGTTYAPIPEQRHRERTSSRRRRRKTIWDFAHFQYSPRSEIGKTLHKAISMLDHFSKKLFRKS